MKTIGIRVTGKVQGVFFRQTTREKARELGIKGWVKNEEAGTVYILATGEAQQLEKLVEWSRRGSQKARVTGVDIIELPLQEFRDFAIER